MAVPRAPPPAPLVHDGHGGVPEDPRERVPVEAQEYNQEASVRAVSVLIMQGHYHLSHRLNSFNHCIALFLLHLKKRRRRVSEKVGQGRRGL